MLYVFLKWAAPGLLGVYESELFAGAIAFLVTLAAILGFSRFLPKDHGREFAVNGALSKGKARGAGLLLILALIVTEVLYQPLSVEYIIYMAALFLEMLSGYLDDAAEKPWGELKKGLIDLFVAIAVSVTVYIYNGSTVSLLLDKGIFTIPAPIYIILGVILIWASINVTNCADGVDGLCASLSTVTLAGAGILLAVWLRRTVTYDIDTSLLQGKLSTLLVLVIAAIAVLLTYLWFNCSPSRILMGDAGSRAVGLLLAVVFMVLGMPFLFVPCALMLIIDGGMGLLKLMVLRVTKSKNFMKNIRTPIHDHARKNKGWSDTQVVTRFTLLQILLTAVSVLLVTQ